MAKVLRIATEDQATTFDFLAGNLQVTEWDTRSSGNGMVVDTMKLISKSGITDANIITATASIDDLAWRAMNFKRNRRVYDSVWLEWNATGESAKRFFVDSIVIKPLVEPQFIYTPLLGYNRAFYELTITRSEVGEQIDTTSVQDNGTSAVGDTVALAAITGALPGRIESIRFLGVTGSLSTFWCGIRPTNHGTSFFYPVWDLEDGTLGTDTSKVVDATASGGNVAQVTFATQAGMYERASMTVLQRITPDTAYEDMIGKYHVLLRAKNDSGVTCNLQMKTGYASSTNFDEGEIQYDFSNTVFQYVDMGVVEIPPFSYRSAYQASNLVKNFEIQIWAARTAGSDKLNIDCIILVPADHFTYSTGSSGGTDASTIHYVNEDGEQVVLGKNSSGEPDIGVLGTFVNWEYPLEGGTLVFVGERAGPASEFDTINLTLTYIKRYLMHREA